MAKFGGHYAEDLRRRGARVGRTWHLNEMGTRLGGRLHRLPRAVEEHGHTLDVLRQAHRVKQAHQPTRLRERVMRRFRSAGSAQRFLKAFSRIGNLFRPRRHRRRAAQYRATMQERVTTWYEIAGLRAA